MERHPVPLRLLLLRLLLSAADVYSSPAAAQHAPRLGARADVCAAQGLNSCSNGFPDNFCCPEDNSCVSLAGGTTVLCCPNRSSCDKIHPITCKIQGQDPNNNLKSPIMTTALDVALPKCAVGGYCCPFGYSCSDAGTECSKNKDQSEPPKRNKPAASSVTTAKPSATSTTSDSSSSAASTAAAAAAASTTPNHVSDAGPAAGSDKGALIGGIAGGVTGLAFLVVVIVLCVRHRRRDASDQTSMEERSTDGDSGTYGNIISAPVLHPGSYRSDFLRRNPESPEPSETHLRHPPRISIPNPFDSPGPSPYSPYSPLGSRASVMSAEELTAKTGHVVGSRLAPIRAMKPTEARYSRRTSTSDLARNPSFEDIDVFADPDTVCSGQSGRPNTTMSDMMDEVGLGDVHRGRRPFVPGTTPRI